MKSRLPILFSLESLSVTAVLLALVAATVWQVKGTPKRVQPKITQCHDPSFRFPPANIRAAIHFFRIVNAARKP